jgi:hypothetical protein
MALEAGAVGEEGVVHLSWSKYTGEAFGDYRILKNGTVILEIENVNTLSADITLPEPGEYHIQLKVKSTGGVIVGISNVVTVVWESTPI